MVFDEQVAVGEVGVHEAVVVASQLEVFAVDCGFNSFVVLVFCAQEHVDVEVVCDVFLVGDESLYVYLLAARGVEAVAAIERLFAGQYRLYIAVIGVDQVAVVKAWHGVALIGAVALVVAYLAREHEVLDGLVAHLAVDHDAVALGLAIVAVTAEVGRYDCAYALGVEQLVPAVVVVGPVHVALFGLVVAHVVVDAPVVDGRHRVAEAARLAVHIVGAQVEGDLARGLVHALEEDGELVFVVLGHDTVAFGVGSRGIGVELLGTARDAQVIFLEEAGAQEVAHVVVALLATLQVGAPAATATVLLVHAFHARGEHALYLRHAHGGAELDACVAVHLHAAVAGAALGGDHDHAVGGLLAVEGACCCALKHAHVLDIVGVDVTQRSAVTAYCHAVDNHQRLVVLGVVDRRDGTYDHLGRRVG